MKHGYIGTSSSVFWVGKEVDLYHVGTRLGGEVMLVTVGLLKCFGKICSYSRWLIVIKVVRLLVLFFILV